jgi:serine-type D-Ala-D-Ala carboxypeptidase/endopeptidase
MKRAILAVAGLAVAASLGANVKVVQQNVTPSDAEIRDILVQRIDVMHRSLGIVVGVVDANGRRVVAYGHLNQGDSRPLNGETIFEIGSATKVFTSLLLSEMVQRGEVALDDPVAKYLPSDVKVPERDGKQITLVDLATHTSGLPRLPTNFAPQDMNNPYVDYTVDDLYQFLSSYQLPRDPGAKYEYSNLGGGLLGLALSRRAAMSYGELVQKNICDPLGMNGTRIELTPEMEARLAVGHNAAMQPVANWEFGPATAGAGALRSDADDMLTFVAANLGYVKTPLAPAMAAMLKVRRPTGTQGLEVALGWHVLTNGGNEIIWHNGGTGGYRSFIGFNPRTRVGVVALSNAEVPEGVDDIGRHLLDSKLPLMKPASEHKEVQVDSKIFDGYVGTYQLAPNVFFWITRDGDHLFAQLTGQAKYEIFPESDKDFFYKVVDAQITFVTDSNGKATALILHQNGLDQRAERVEGASAPQPPAQPKEVKVDPAILQKYVGTYQLTPGFAITITLDGDQLYEQATGQGKAAIYPKSETEFFLKVVDAQITFVTGDSGPATQMVLHQGGMNLPGKRVQ